MTAEELLQKYPMEGHPENGLFLERHYPHTGPGRAASGGIHFYVAPGDRTVFHRIDCDEWWAFHAGADLDVWVVDPEGALTIHTLGEGGALLAFVPRGCIFAARHGDMARGGSFVSNITVPRYSTDSLELFTKEQMLALCPAVAAFWE